MIQSILNRLKITFEEDGFQVISDNSNVVILVVKGVEFKLIFTAKTIIIQVNGLQEVSLKLGDASLMDKVEGVILGSILKFV